VASGAVVIQFPVKKKTCWDCEWHVELTDKDGLLSSGCDLFDEEVHDENVAEDCDGWLDAGL